MAVSISTAQNTVIVSQESAPTIILQDVGIQGPRGVPGSGSVADTSSLASTGSNDFVGNQSFDGDVAITGSLTVSGSNTFTVIGPTVLQGSVTLISGSLTGTVSTASYTLFAESASYSDYTVTASYALNAGVTVNTGSLITTASFSGTTLTFTKGDASTFDVSLSALSGGGGTGSVDNAFVSASSAGPAGSITFTQGDGSTQTVTLGSSFVTADVPSNEIVVFPTQSFTQIGSNFTVLTQFGPAAQNYPYSYAWTPTTSTGAVVDGAYLFVRDRTNTWGDLSIGGYVAIKSSGSLSRASYYTVLSISTSTYQYAGILETIRMISMRAVDNSNLFSGNSQANIFGTVSAPPEYALPTTGSFGLYTSAFLASSNLATNFTNQVALVSGSTPAGTWLYIGASPTSGTALSTSVGRYVGFSGDGSSWTYYQVNGQSYTNASSDYFIGLTAVDSEYTAAQYSNVYLSGFNRIPTHPYYRSLSHITHPITPSGTSDASGSIGDVSYDDSYFYVKTSAGWKRTALSTW